MLKKHVKGIWLFIISVIGLGIRLLSCLWGFPYLLHPDEGTIVDTTVEMVNRSSWEADNFAWPAQLLMKLNSIVFNRACFIRYNDIVADTFEDHRIFYYMLARILTCLFGVLMIILAYFIVEKLRNNMGLLAALVVAIYPVFVKHSAYSTPDIPLCTLMLFIILMSMQYLEKPSEYVFYGICVLVGCSFCTKYPGIFFVVFPAFIAIQKGISDKKVSFILLKALQAFLTIFLTTFLIMPNFFTNFNGMLNAVAFEADHDVPGAMDYGFFGNLFYYFRNMFQYGGVILVILALFGIIWCIRNNDLKAKIPLLSFVYVFFICTLKLQWERWGMPFYTVFAIFAVLGIVQILDLIREKAEDKKSLKFVLYFVVLIFLANIATGAARSVTSCVVKENRVRALDYCQENGITAENTLFDGYTPFLMDHSTKIKVPLDDAGNLAFKKDTKIKYCIVSSANYERYYIEPVSEQSMKDRVRYDAIFNSLKLVAKWEEYDRNSFLSVVNTFYSVDETIKMLNGAPSGVTISIYEVP